MPLEKLRAEIYEQYDSMSQFAQKIGWSRQRLSNIVLGKQRANTSDVKTLADALNISGEMLFDFFMPERSRNS